MRQLTLEFDKVRDHFTGQELKEAGMDQCTRTANETMEHWSELAYNFLQEYITQVGEFMTEELRSAAKGTVPDPPNLRAWGGVINKAAKAKIIIRVGYGPVTNPRAHCANATIWRAAA